MPSKNNSGNSYKEKDVVVQESCPEAIPSAIEPKVEEESTLGDEGFEPPF